MLEQAKGAKDIEIRNRTFVKWSMTQVAYTGTWWDEIWRLTNSLQAEGLMSMPVV